MELTPEDLVRRAREDDLPFNTTAEVTPLETPLAQERAREALDFGMRMGFAGYNVYALGVPQTDKRSIILHRLERLAADHERPHDWCYVENFEDRGRPIAIRFPAGEGRRFRRQMQEFLASVQTMIPAAFSTEEYQQASQAIASAFQKTQSEDVAELEQEAEKLGLTMLPTPNGFAFAPVSNGRVMEQEEFLALDEGARQQIQNAINLMTERLIERLRDYPKHQQELVEKRRALQQDTAAKVIRHLLARLRTLYAADERIMRYFEQCEQTLLDNLERIVAPKNQPYGLPMLGVAGQETFFDRFAVNLIVDAAELSGAPVLYESNPSLENLVGKLEHRMEYGNLVTDFGYIRAGALHKANGGYLVLDAERLLQKPFAWEALKRALADECVRIESVSQLLNLTYSVSLEPDSVPLDVKVVLLGSRMLYHLLREYDPDFADLFKVVADFADDIEWNQENESAYAAVLAHIVQESSTLHMDRGAVGCVLEHASRRVEDRERLSTHISELRDLVHEADLLARDDNDELIRRKHIETAIERRIYRLDRFRELVRENIARGLIVIETRGVKVGQVNGLSVVHLGELFFGQPSRITATARLGRGEVIDIERESKLGGKIHTKAVMIVSSFIGSRYAKDCPLSLHASLVFEQSYGGVEGDSASIAEVCALMSAIIDQPIRQDIALTGSMDQYGTAQAIGGVNEKIEGFYEICLAQGLTGTQGVIIPAANKHHLMLRKDVVQAVRDGQFHVYTADTIDDAAAILLAGEGQERADMEDINNRISARLRELYAIAKPGRGQDDGA